MGGCGKVGTALVDALNVRSNEVFILDQQEDFKPTEDIEYEFLHVAIPFTPYFNAAVKNAIRNYSPRYVVIHSTVPVGTTRRLGSNAAHSPVRGQHDRLNEGVYKFIKYVGAHNAKTREAVAEHLASVGMPVEVWGKPEDTELMKLLCLTRYLNDLAFYEASFGLCRRFGVSPGRLVQWTGTYNEGYQGTNWTRPELVFPMGKVGGHCVMPVAKMLFNQNQSTWLKRNIELFEKSPKEKKVDAKNS